MKKVELYAKVRYAVQVEGLSERAAARRFGIDPRTVGKMMEFSLPPGYRRSKPRAKPKLDRFIAVIDNLLADDKRRPKKQQHTAKRIFERLGGVHRRRISTRNVVSRDAKTLPRARGPFELLTLAIPFETLAERFESIVPSFRDFGALHARAFMDAESEALLRTLWRVADDDAPATALRIEGALNTLLARLLELTDQNAAMKGLDGSLSAQNIERVRAYIRAQMVEQIRLEDLASVADCSAFQLARRFKQAFGCSPYAYLTRIRVDEVRSLLASPRPRALSDIAASCGFADQAHMTRAFKKRFGLAPGTYRKDVRK